jgi:hypothetical protein
MSETTHSYPTTMKKLRACFNCHLVKTEQQVNQNYFDLFFKLCVFIVFGQGM